MRWFGTGAARRGCDGPANFGDLVEEHVAAKAVALGLVGRVEAVNADVDDGGALFHIFSGDHLGLTDGYDEDVGTAADLRQFLGVAVANGHRGVDILL